MKTIISLMLFLIVGFIPIAHGAVALQDGYDQDHTQAKIDEALWEHDQFLKYREEDKRRNEEMEENNRERFKILYPSTESSEEDETIFEKKKRALQNVFE